MVFITQYFKPGHDQNGKIYRSDMNGLTWKGDKLEGPVYNFHGMQEFASERPNLYPFKLTVIYDV